LYFLNQPVGLADEIKRSGDEVERDFGVSRDIMMLAEDLDAGGEAILAFEGDIADRCLNNAAVSIRPAKRNM
jgi:hypothetical protein